MYRPVADIIKLRRRICAILLGDVGIYECAPRRPTLLCMTARRKYDVVKIIIQA